MGRTNPTFRERLRGFERRWRPFRRGLRAQYRGDFDRLLEGAGRFAHAGSYLNATDPGRTVLVSMLLAQAVALRELEARVEALEGADD